MTTSSSQVVPLFATILLVVPLLSAIHLSHAQNDPIYDVEGDELQKGGHYYILPWAPNARGYGQGGLHLAASNTSSCLTKVALWSLQGGDPLPVRICSENPVSTTVRQREVVDFRFFKVPKCVRFPDWAVTQEGRSPHVVVLDDALESGSSRLAIAPGEFHIVERSAAGTMSGLHKYVIRSCVLGEKQCVGVSYHQGFLVLGNGADEVEFVFRKVEPEGRIKMKRV